MSYKTEIKLVKKTLVGGRKHLVIKSHEGKILDRTSDLHPGIKKASFFDYVSLQGKRVRLGGRIYTLKNKSLNAFMVRNGLRLSFDIYSVPVHRAISEGFESAVRFIPRQNGIKKSEIRGQLILKCLKLSESERLDESLFPYSADSKSFKKGYEDAHKWEVFFINIWKLGR